MVMTMTTITIKYHSYNTSNTFPLNSIDITLMTTTTVSTARVEMITIMDIAVLMLSGWAWYVQGKSCPSILVYWWHLQKSIHISGQCTYPAARLKWAFVVACSSCHNDDSTLSKLHLCCCSQVLVGIVFITILDVICSALFFSMMSLVSSLSLLLLE